MNSMNITPNIRRIVFRSIIAQHSKDKNSVECVKKPFSRWSWFLWKKKSLSSDLESGADSFAAWPPASASWSTSSRPDAGSTFESKIFPLNSHPQLIKKHQEGGACGWRAFFSSNSGKLYLYVVLLQLPKWSEFADFLNNMLRFLGSL